MLVALSAFASASAASDSDDEYAVASQQLADANFWYEQGAATLRQDLQNFLAIEADQYCTIDLIFEGDAAVCEDLTEDELEAAIDWAAEDEILAQANLNQAEADAQLASGLTNSTRSVRYQAALVLFAIGLALSAWASLADSSSRAWLMFVVLAAMSTGVGLLRLLTV